MKRGFTLLELVIVIIIVGVLATLGFANYTRMVEKSRGVEARQIFADMRTLAQAYWTEHNDSIAGMLPIDVGIGVGAVPGACATTHYFAYSITVANPSVTLRALRCGIGTGKDPGRNGGALANALTLTSNLQSGVDAWLNQPPY